MSNNIKYGEGFSFFIFVGNGRCVQGHSCSKNNYDLINFIIKTCSEHNMDIYSIFQQIEQNLRTNNIIIDSEIDVIVLKILKKYIKNE